MFFLKGKNEKKGLSQYLGVQTGKRDNRFPFPTYIHCYAFIPDCLYLHCSWHRTRTQTLILHLTKHFLTKTTRSCVSPFLPGVLSSCKQSKVTLDRDEYSSLLLVEPLPRFEFSTLQAEEETEPDSPPFRGTALISSELLNTFSESRFQVCS